MGATRPTAMVQGFEKVATANILFKAEEQKGTKDHKPGSWSAVESPNAVWFWHPADGG